MGRELREKEVPQSQSLQSWSKDQGARIDTVHEWDTRPDKVGTTVFHSSSNIILFHLHSNSLR